MPTYQYRCTDCADEFETVQKFSDPALTTCAQCGGELRKVYGNVGIVFKGSGFYATDSRTTDKSTTTTSAPDPQPATKPDTKPASTPAAKTVDN